jgi:aromatic ring hydroxylase
VAAAGERADPADRRWGLHGDAVPGRPLIDKFFQAAGAEAERRIRLFRLAWDYIGSDLGGRGELYERFYLSDSWRMTALAYSIADKTFPESIVEQFLTD